MDRMDRGGMGMGPDPMGTGPMGGTHTARGMGPGVGPMGGGPMDPHHRSSSMPGLATNAILFCLLQSVIDLPAGRQIHVLFRSFQQLINSLLLPILQRYTDAVKLSYLAKKSLYK